MSGPTDPSGIDTRKRVMLATMAVLGEHGYAGLSIQRIADEADLGKSSVYHLFDGKDDLLLSFLGFVVERFQRPLEEASGDDPLADLWTHLDLALHGATEGAPTTFEGDTDHGTSGPFVEMRAQAAHDERFRDRFTDVDDALGERLAAVVRSGVDEGVFRDVDPEATAELLLTVMTGALFRRTTADAVDVDAVEAELERVVEATLLAEDGGG